MSRLPATTRRPLDTLALILALAAPARAAPDLPPGSAPGAAEMARCAAIDSRDARLACFDEISGSRRAAPASPAAPAAASKPLAPRPEPAAPAGPDAERDFGLSPVQRHDAPRGPAAIHARIASMTQDAQGHTTAVLDNGQTWTFVNEDPRLANGAAITIKRAALGAFLILTASNHSFHARRIN